MRGDGLKRLQAALEEGGCQVRGSAARCPAHDDANPSLSIGQGERGAVLTCHAGCSTEDVLAALALTFGDLFDDPAARKRGWEVTAVYTYTDRHGKPLFYVERRQPKDFRAYRMENGRKRWSLNGTPRVPYRLPEVLQAASSGGTVYICEGEKDADALAAAGAVATTNPGGAGKWPPGFNRYLAGAGRVVVVADRDPPGYAHAAKVAASVREVVPDVTVAEAAQGKDYSDHAQAGYGLADLRPVTPAPELINDIDKFPDDAARSSLARDDLPDDGGNPVAARLAEVRAALLDSDALESLAPPRPVIDGLLYRDGIAFLYGKPGTYKTVIAIDWASCVSAGLPWQGRETAQGKVLYLYAEGTAGLRQRVRAWEDHAGRKTQVTFLPMPLQVGEPVDGAVLRQLIAEMRPVLIVADTMARCAVGLEENSTTEMGRLVQAATALTRICGSCLLFIHHEPRNGDNPRGSIALEGAATSVFRADRDGDRITLENRRQRDAPEADPVTLTAVPHLGSVIAVSRTGSGTLPPASASEALITRTLRDTAPDTGASATLLMELTGLSRTTFYSAVKALVRRGEVISAGTRNRSRYELAAGQVPLVSGSVQPVSTQSGSPVFSVRPPFRGADTANTDGPDTERQWPEGSHGAEANTTEEET